MDTLLTFTGFHDPYALGLVGQEEQPGPILSMGGARSFDKIVLFSTPSAEKNTLATRDALQSLYPMLHVEVRDFPLNRSTRDGDIVKGDPRGSLPPGEGEVFLNPFAPGGGR